jgi:aspartyl-tRNA(Asn)/glutamyl-tRNA(Gln) amidotransferase subunit A
LSNFVAAVFDVADLFHAPSIPMPVPTVAESDLADDPKFNEFVGRLTSYNRPFNYMGLPALCLPAGFDAQGLPVGFQLVGRPFDEAMLIRAGDAYERETTWTQMAPSL